MRECGHQEPLPAGECELCDADWLIAYGLDTEEQEEMDDARAEIVAGLKRSPAVAECVRREIKRSKGR